MCMLIAQPFAMAIFFFFIFYVFVWYSYSFALTNWTVNCWQRAHAIRIINIPQAKTIQKIKFYLVYHEFLSTIVFYEEKKTHEIHKNPKNCYPIFQCKCSWQRMHHHRKVATMMIMMIHKQKPNHFRFNDFECISVWAL